MAKFCSECGESTTELMRRCPKCGAELLCSTKSDGTLTRIAIICIGVAIIMSTFLGWYSLRLSIDGGVMDVIVNSVTPLVAGYSGISTTYGLVIFGMALAMIIFAICRNRWLTAMAAIGCVVVGVMALVSPPELADLWQKPTTDGAKLMDIFDGPMQGLSPMNSPKLMPLTMIFEVITDYITVEVRHGVKIMLILACAAATLSIYDVARSLIKRK